MRENLTSKVLRCGSHSLTCQYTTPAFTHSSPGGTTTEWTVTAPADEAYYSLINPMRMKGWVGLVGWITVDVWPTKWSSIQLAVRRRTGKVRRSKTSILPLCYAANWAHLIFLGNEACSNHWVCDVWPSHRTSPHFGRYQIILLGDKRTFCMNNSPRVVTRKWNGRQSNPQQPR